MVQVELRRIMICETSDHQHIVLKEKDGEREFPIVIGLYEAMAIDRGVKHLAMPRPLTHDLLWAVIQKLGASLDQVLINDLRDGTFYATLVLSRNGERIEMDCRPSDAIALAVQGSVPIFAAEHVIYEVSNWGVV